MFSWWQRLIIRQHQLILSLTLNLLWLVPAHISFYWGALVYPAIVVYLLLIILNQILIDDYAAVIISGMTSVWLVLLAYLQQHGLLPVKYYECQLMTGLGNSLLIAGAISLAPFFGWLIKIKLQQEQAVVNKKISPLCQLVEMGRTTSEIFHDISNPLSSIKLDLEELCHLKSPPEELVARVRNALAGINYIEQFIEAGQQQLQFQPVKRFFSPERELVKATKFLAAKATAARVEFKLNVVVKLCFYGYQNKFHQIVANLISNAIDAYEDVLAATKRQVWINLTQQNSDLVLEIKDCGRGIAPQNLSSIYETFYTTKLSKNSLGLGLTIVKNAVEKNFGGRIECESELGKGSVFRVFFPLS